MASPSQGGSPRWFEGNGTESWLLHNPVLAPASASSTGSSSLLNAFRGSAAGPTAVEGFSSTAANHSMATINSAFLREAADNSTILISSAETSEQRRGVQAEVHHHLVHGPLDPQKALKTGGLCFAPVYNEIDNMKRKGGKRFTFQIMSVGLQAVTGVLTGISAYGVGLASEKLGQVRLDIVLHMIRHYSTWEAWLASFGIMLALALAGALPVIIWVQSAGSSGIPAIIGILNGCDLTKEFNLKTFAARLIGVTCAVSSGLAVGPEGPMIFIGAAIGALLSRIPSQPWVWEKLGRPPSSLNHHVYMRDYISTGAACGIAAAFRAPIAGTLFVVEEAASHFRREHLAKVFFASLVAMLLATYPAGQDGLLEFQVATGPNCRTQQWLQATDYFFFILVGIVCGVAGAVFNEMNVRLACWRAQHVKGAMQLRRTAEIVVLCFITSSCWMLLPLFIEERSAGDPKIFSRGNTCIKDKWLPQIVREANIEEAGGSVGVNLKYTPEPCLYGIQHNPTECQWAWEMSQNGSHPSSLTLHAYNCTHELIYGNKMQHLLNKMDYCCNFSNRSLLMAGQHQVPLNASCSIVLGDGFPTLRSTHSALQMKPRDRRRLGDDGVPKDVQYNPMAALCLVSFDDTAQNLFSRGAPYVFYPTVLLYFLPAFFILAAVTSGSAIPSGLLLPMIIIGALIGRVLAIALIGFQHAVGFYHPAGGNTAAGDSLWSSVFQPWFYYSGGPLREDAPLSTSGWLDPGVGAIIGAAAFMGGCTRISLTVTVMMVEITGDAMMIAPVGVATLVAVIVANQFNHGLYHSLIDVASFPFLPDRWPKAIPKALRVEHLIREGESVMCLPLRGQRPQVEQVLRDHDYSAFPVLDDNGVVVGIAFRKLLQQILDELHDTVDVGKVTDFHYVTIRASLPLEVAYDLFKRMEISHMIVVDNNHHPVAMLTRGSLLPWCVEERIGHRRMANVRSTIERPRQFRCDGLVNDTFWTEHQLFSEAEHGQASRLTPQGQISPSGPLLDMSSENSGSLPSVRGGGLSANQSQQESQETFQAG